MESANHEFTWLSGRAQASVAQEAKSSNHLDSSSPSSSPQSGRTFVNPTTTTTDKPTALPRKLKSTVSSTTSLHSSLEKPTNHIAASSAAAAAIHKPTPLPRIFHRSSSITGITPNSSSSSSSGSSRNNNNEQPIYDLPPAPEGSIFYVATPKQLPPRPVDQSIILEFDPILQNPNSAIDDVNLRLSRFFIDTPAPLPAAEPVEERKSPPQSTSAKTTKLKTHVRRSLSTASSSSSSSLSGSSNSKDANSDHVLQVALPSKAVNGSSSSVVGQDLGSKPGRVVSNAYCDPPTVAAMTPPSLPPRSRDQGGDGGVAMAPDGVTPRYALPFDCLRAPELPPKSPTRRKPQLPVGCTLSSVPPPPPESPSDFVESVTAPPPPPPPKQSLQAVSTTKEPMVENPFYQFFQAAASAPPPPPRPVVGVPRLNHNRDVVSIFDSGSSESDNDDSSEATPPSTNSNPRHAPRHDPPRFPPPPLRTAQFPPPASLTNGQRYAEPPATMPTSPPPSYSAVTSPEMDVVLPDWSTLSAAATAVNPVPVPAKRAAGLAASDEARAVCSSGAPVYQNVLAIFGSNDGVYAKINRPSANGGGGGSSVGGSCVDGDTCAVATVATKMAPPPLPPRGRQRPTPPPLPDIQSAVAAVNSQLARQLSDQDHVLEVLRCIPHCGTLFKIGRGRKDVTQKYMVLERGRLQSFAADKTDNPQEVFEQSDLLCVARISDYKQSDLSCFALVTRTCKDRPLLFGAKYPSERESWIQHVIRSIVPAGAAIATNAMSCHRIVKAGYIYLRLSVTGCWQTCWTVLTEKEFQVTLPDSTEQINLDLRKIISLQELVKDPQMNVLSEDKPLFVVSYPAVTLYARSFQPFDTTDWFQRLQEATLTVGLNIEEQQLTHEGVPVLVDKCINYVGVYGIASKGIYRQSATNSKVAKLLDLFRKDAQKVHLQQDDYSEHDIANTLKRFFRKLPDPLMTAALYSQWLALVGSSVEHYRELLKQLPEINYNTLKKLIGHLHSVSLLSEQNMMDVINLAQVFGSTLLCNEGSIDLARTSQEIDVMADLIHNYAVLFGVSTEELDKEAQIQRALQDLRDAKKAQKPAGDIMVGVYVHNRQWGKCLNVKVSPSMSAFDLCLYVTQNVRIKDRLDQLSVYEVVCDGELERPLHFSEMVLSVTLRWAGWADQDARNNYLMVKRNEIIQTILPMAQRPFSMFGELKFAELKSKSFKKFMFEFKNAKLAYYKDAKISQPLGSWNIEDITWYLGVESKRSPSSENAKFSVTFVESKAVVNRSSRDSPYFGRCVCFSSEVDFHKWIAALMIGQYPEGLLPRYKPIDLLS